MRTLQQRRKDAAITVMETIVPRDEESLSETRRTRMEDMLAESLVFFCFGSRAKVIYLLSDTGAVVQIRDFDGKHMLRQLADWLGGQVAPVLPRKDPADKSVRWARARRAEEALRAANLWVSKQGWRVSLRRGLEEFTTFHSSMVARNGVTRRFDDELELLDWLKRKVPRISEDNETESESESEEEDDADDVDVDDEDDDDDDDDTNTVVNKEEKNKKRKTAHVPSPAAAKKQAPSPAAAKKQAPSPAAAKKQAPSPAAAKQQAPSPAAAKKQAPSPAAAKQQAPSPAVAKKAPMTPPSAKINTSTAKKTPTKTFDAESEEFDEKIRSDNFCDDEDDEEQTWDAARFMHEARAPLQDEQMTCTMYREWQERLATRWLAALEDINEGVAKELVALGDSLSVSNRPALAKITTRVKADVERWGDALDEA
jgi:hypothetical protein